MYFNLRHEVYFNLRLLRLGGGLRLQSLGQPVGDALHQLLHAHFDLDAGPTGRIEALLMAALYSFAAQAEAEPAAGVLEARTALALVVGHAVAVLRTPALTDRAAGELVVPMDGLLVEVGGLVAAQTVAAVRLAAVAVHGAGLLTDGFTESEENGAVAGAAHLDVVPTHPLLVNHIVVSISGAYDSVLGHWHLVLDTDVLLAVAVGDGQTQDRQLGPSDQDDTHNRAQNWEEHLADPDSLWAGLEIVRTPLQVH